MYLALHYLIIIHVNITDIFAYITDIPVYITDIFAYITDITVYITNFTYTFTHVYLTDIYVYVIDPEMWKLQIYCLLTLYFQWPLTDADTGPSIANYLKKID